ncbi:MAG TPA: ammonium transporter, partial [Gammaproteobacteria bacterium]|nr:ammonium transporter [Gammaproteobacteria bacterium]
PVHGIGGILGTFLAGIFASTQLGLFSGQGFAEGINSIPEQLKVQVIGIVAVLVYTAVVTWILLKIVDVMVGLRVSIEEETEGLDIASHEERAYDIH